MTASHKFFPFQPAFPPLSTIEVKSGRWAWRYSQFCHCAQSILSNDLYDNNTVLPIMEVSFQRKYLCGWRHSTAQKRFLEWAPGSRQQYFACRDSQCCNRVPQRIFHQTCSWTSGSQRCACFHEGLCLWKTHTYFGSPNANKAKRWVRGTNRITILHNAKWAIEEGNLGDGAGNNRQEVAAQVEQLSLLVQPQLGVRVRSAQLLFEQIHRILQVLSLLLQSASNKVIQW